MATVALILALLAVAGALGGWIVGAIAYRAAVRRTGNAPGVVMSLMVWPFTREQATAASAAERATMNKALVVIIACATLAAAAGSVATNLHRIAK